MRTAFTLTLLSFFLIPMISSAQEAEIIELDIPLTEMTFEYEKFDFGEIQSGEIATHLFKFTNTGDHPLILENVKPSCGCTVPFFPKVAIMPGETSEIEVNFDSKNKKGVQHKSITITANTEPRIKVLTFSGEVVEGDPTDQSPEEMEMAEQRKKDRESIEAISPNCMSIFPNPTSDLLQLELREHIGMSAKVQIFNEAGQVVMEDQIDAITRETSRFDVSTFAEGIYRIVIRIDNVKPLSQCFVVTGH